MEQVPGQSRALDAPNAGVLAAFWDLIKLRIRQRPLTQTEQRAISLLEYGSFAFGASILDAQDVQDLEVRIETVLDLPAWPRFLTLLMEEVTLGLLEEGGDRPVESSAEEVEVFGQGVARRLEEARRLSALAADALSRLLRVGDPRVQEAIQSVREGGGISCLTDPAVPGVVSQILHGSMQGTVCLLATCRAMLQGRRLAPWLALALAERIVNGVRGHLRLLASLPEVTSPEEVVPPGERLDLAELERGARLVEEKTQRLFMAARTSGQAVYAPFGLRS